MIELECTDNGKPEWGATKDIGFACKIFRSVAGDCTRLGGQSFARDATSQYGYTRLEPRGVAACITPWNYPLLMTTFKMAPLLASGCTGVFKTPEYTPLSSLKMAEIWESVEGAVPGVINMVPGIGKEAGEALVEHPDVASIHFTGSTATGVRITQKAAPTMKRVFLELGGKSPLIVFDDAKIEKAATIASVFGTVNTGQFCGASTRFIVHEKVHDEFVAKLVEKVKAQKYGRWDSEPGIWGGPVIN